MMKKIYLRFCSYETDSHPKAVVNKRWQLWHLTVARFNCACEHTPKDVADGHRLCRLERIKMHEFNRNCKTRRWWLYFRDHSFCFDWR